MWAFRGGLQLSMQGLRRLGASDGMGMLGPSPRRPWSTLHGICPSSEPRKWSPTEPPHAITASKKKSLNTAGEGGTSVTTRSSACAAAGSFAQNTGAVV